MDGVHLGENLEDKDTEFTWEVKANDRTYHKQFKKKGFLCWRQKKYKAGFFCLSLLSAVMTGLCYHVLLLCLFSPSLLTSPPSLRANPAADSAGLPSGISTISCCLTQLHDFALSRTSINACWRPCIQLALHQAAGVQ
ncbi:mCG13387 [Mus musculus]|uniref:ATPase, class I, type 8B, member 3 n=1 Tax=Mus musculus TaxID=10090 RepID=Q9CPY8_MOUSE|nr:Atp8b3 protein [Mus musculus]EDL31537.1 mCG13387 [Mus musculus]BAB24703.1 unnamed protein product [Mus musculus]BAB31468.1 unnamed protein product [Mus musculus]BAB31471.1 unnamed protein product [Mus musculus]